MTPLTEVELMPVTEVRFLRPILIVSTPSMPVPEIVTTVPTGPEVGEIPVMVGPIDGLRLHPFEIATAICVGEFETGAAASGTK